jgi:hypothetical protein
MKRTSTHSFFTHFCAKFLYRPTHPHTSQHQCAFHACMPANVYVYVCIYRTSFFLFYDNSTESCLAVSIPCSWHAYIVLIRCRNNSFVTWGFCFFRRFASSRPFYPACGACGRGLSPEVFSRPASKLPEVRAAAEDLSGWGSALRDYFRQEEVCLLRVSKARLWEGLLLTYFSPILCPLIAY